MVLPQPVQSLARTAAGSMGWTDCCQCTWQLIKSSRKWNWTHLEEVLRGIDGPEATQICQHRHTYVFVTRNRAVAFIKHHVALRKSKRPCRPHRSTLQQRFRTQKREWLALSVIHTWSLDSFCVRSVYSRKTARLKCYPKCFVYAPELR